MSKETIDNVNYFEKDDFYIVGDNISSQTGIASSSYAGEITIQEKVNGKSVKEISRYAFDYCQGITKVTILAKLTRINEWAFVDCKNIQYINIPETTTFIGAGAFALAGDGAIVSTPITLEFNEGRTEEVFIGSCGISYRTNFVIIYPSNIQPLFDLNNQFYGVSTVIICAHSVFSFCGYFTTTNMSRCPAQIFKAQPKANPRCTCIRKIYKARQFSYYSSYSTV